MAKLTKAEAKAHAAAVALLAKDTLTHDEKWFVLENWNEGANHVNGTAGAFFTPPDLAADFAIDALGGRVIDLCAGIGTLAFACASRWRYTNPEAARSIVCVEKNPDYVAIGRKLLPEATWICGDVFELDLSELGHFDCAIANPPFGATPRTGRGPRFTGRAFEYHLIDLAADLADHGAFIIPQGSAPFVYSGAQCYRDTKPAAYLQFSDQTGVQLSAGCGVDCSYYRDQWKGVAPNVEIVCADFEEARARRPKPRPLAEAPAEAAPIARSARTRSTTKGERDIEAELRAIWTAKDVSLDRQDAMLAEIIAKAQPGARVGPFVLGQTERTPAGPQTVLPGGEADGGASLVRNTAAAPLKAKAPQRACDVGLFDDAARDQLSLL